MPGAGAAAGGGSSRQISTASTIPGRLNQKNMPDQPIRGSIQAATGATKAGPSAKALRYRPLATERCSDGNQSPTSLKLAPLEAPSAAPNSTRRTISTDCPRARPVRPVNTDQATGDAISNARAPNRSASQPPGICMMA